VAGYRNDIASESVVSCPGVGGAGKEKKRWGGEGVCCHCVCKLKSTGNLLT